MVLKFDQLYYPIWRLWGFNLGAAIILKPEDIEVLNETYNDNNNKDKIV